MATKANLTIDQGSDYTTTITLTDGAGTPINISTYTGNGQIRKYYTSTTAVDFDITTADNGNITLSLDSNTTNNMIAGRYVYDVELTDISGNISRVLEGIVTIKPGVTR